MSTFSRLQSAPTGFCRSRGVRKQDLQDIQDVQDKRHLFAGRETLFILFILVILDILLRFLHLRWAQAMPT